MDTDRGIFAANSMRLERPTDYSAAYVEELLNQQEMALDLIQGQLDQARRALNMLRPQVKPV